MNLQAGLSFDQAPPLALPLRFFLTAPMFLIAAGVLIALAPDALTSRWTPQALALTHALTLGFLALTMLGALMQILPVVAGASMPAPVFVARFSHVPITLGTIALMAGFLTAAPFAFGVAIALLGAGFLVFLTAIAISLTRAVTSVTVTGIRFAVSSLAATIVLGGMLALMRTGVWAPPAIEAALAAHIALGLLGWVMLLIVGVAYQVVPMFQITPPYPPMLSRWLAGALFVLLLLHAAEPWLVPGAIQIIDLILAAGILLFAFSTLRLQSRRRRKLPDVALNFWRLGMTSLMASVLAWFTAQFWPAWAASPAYPLMLGVLFIGGCAISVVNSMLYKIVPFLAWFHLQAQLQARAGSIPTMRDMIAESGMRWQFRTHLASVLLTIVAIGFPWLTVVAGLALAGSAGMLWLNLLSAARRFSRHGGRLH